MSSDHNSPPTGWCDWWSGITRVTDDLYFGWPDGETNPWFWHWCTKANRWSGAGTSSHNLVSREPLHLEPSLLWPCCQMHGWLRRGSWEAA